MEEKWPAECPAKDDRECRARRQARVDQLNFSLRDFVARHPQWILERTVYDTLDPEVRWSCFHEPEARKLYNRFRGLLQEKDPEAQFRTVLSILFDVLVRHKQDQLDALTAKDEPVADPSALLDGMSRSLKVLERIEEQIGRSLSSLRKMQAMTCGGEDRAACRQLHRVRRLLLQLWSDNPEKPALLQEYQGTAGDALQVIARHMKQPAGAGRTRRFITEVVEGHAGFLVEKKAELEKLGRDLGLDRTAFSGKAELMELIREFKSLLAPDPDSEKARLRLELTRLEVLRRLLQAVLDQDHSEILRSFIDLIQTAEANLSPGLRKGIATLRLIIGLLEPDGPGEKPQDAQKRRVQLLQEFADQMSNRKGRNGEWITSVGVSAFSGGGLDWNDALGTRGQFQPVSLPIGISLQWFSPSGHGFHAMAYPLDIAQYARTDTTDEEVAVPKPSFYTALTFGVQLAYARLVRDIPFTMGIDLRYIPYIGYEEKVRQEDGTEALVAKTRRHLQILWFVGFHFPLLDFN
ncbi:MAG: hypothetical protein CVU59_12285 [Deltaproteobacteria bacterium HGW-Deltaproteobacteria-17]|nr:MAG: hypothetical protein CVU59_12285 [Deltaproteobacteria bacterium HGW-Deltaproteobacteria-17]